MESSSVDIENNIFTSSKSDIGYKNAMLKKVDVAIGQKSMTTHSVASRALYLDRGNVVEDFCENLAFCCLLLRQPQLWRLANQT